VEYILELNPARQIVLPEDLVVAADLKPGAHFEARVEGKRLVIEQLPFSSQAQAEILNATIREL